MARILVMEGGKITPVESRKFLQEADLHDYLEQFPELLPLEEIEDNPPSTIVIGREVPVPSGSIDLLLIDASARLTIVETKLAKNPEVRREVIGQVIEYASFISQWDADRIERQAAQYLSLKARKQITMYQALSLKNTDSGEILDQDAFRTRLEQGLAKGNIRLVIAVDELVEALRSTVAFLNSFSDFDLVILQLHHFELDVAKHVFIPSLYSAPSKGGRQRRQWDEGSFVEHLKANNDPETVAYTLKILERFKHWTDEPLWGTGTTVGSFNLVVPTGTSRLNFAAITSGGTLYINFGHICRVNEAAVEPLANALRSVDGITLPSDLSSRYPPIPKRVLRDSVRLERVLQIIQTTLEMLRK